MAKAIEVRVTQDHIDQGQKRICSFCPVALAIRDILGKRRMRVVKVGGMTVTVGDNDAWSFSPAIQRFIARFDNGETVKPFKFYLVTPKVSLYWHQKPIKKRRAMCRIPKM